MSNGNKQPDERAAFEAWKQGWWFCGGGTSDAEVCSYADAESAAESAFEAGVAHARATQQATTGDERAATEKVGAVERADQFDKWAAASAEERAWDQPPVISRDFLGELVRDAWVKWAKQQPNPKPSWLVCYWELSEADKEADRQIGEAVWDWAYRVKGALRATTPVAGSAGQAPIYQNKLKRADSWCDCDKATFDHTSKHPQRFDVRVLYAAPTAPSLATYAEEDK